MCKNGEIYMAKLGTDDEGSLQSGIRPVLVVSNDMANKYSPVITIVPLTTKTDKKKLPTHVPISNCGLPRPSIVLAEQITALNQSRLIRKIGSIRMTVYEKNVKEAMKIQLAM